MRNPTDLWKLLQEHEPAIFECSCGAQGPHDMHLITDVLLQFALTIAFTEDISLDQIDGSAILAELNRQIAGE